MVKNTLIMVSEGGLSKKVNLKGFRGFTLAEVLITLVIIGVIAAMTIPTLINKTNNQELVSKLKKTYSTLAQATNRIIADEGKPRGDIGGWASSNEAVYNMYKKYLSVAKDCGLNTGCFEGIYKQLNGTTVDLDTNRYTFVMADGTYVSIWKHGDFDASCSSSASGSDNFCSIIKVDVNGAKGPNTGGRDTFAFTLKEDGLHPSGCDITTNGCRVGIDGGWACTCKVLREGAMNY